MPIRDKNRFPLPFVLTTAAVLVFGSLLAIDAGQPNIEVSAEDTQTAQFIRSGAVGDSDTDGEGPLEPQILLTDKVKPSKSQRFHSALNRKSPGWIVEDPNSDEAVDFLVLRPTPDRDGHSDSAFEPLPTIPPIGISPSCRLRDHRLSVWPVSGVLSRDWTVNNYRDLDPAQDTNNDNQELADYVVAGPNAKTYDQHRGIDIDIPSFRDMDSDSSLILAAAPGVVETIDEAFPDRNTFWPAGCGNANNRITVRHPQGFLMSYLHLKTNSVSDVAGLAVGNSVEPGQVLGVVGSAGCSTQAHLHFQVNDCDGNVVDPFQQNMWDDPPPYNAPLGFMDAVIKQSIPSGNGFIPFMKDPGPDDRAVLPSQTFNIGIMVGGGQPGDMYEFEIFDPDGNELGDGKFQSTVNSVQRRRWDLWNVIPYDIPGEWLFRILVNNVQQGTRKFCVSKYTSFTSFGIVRFGVPGSLYQYEFDHAVCAGYRPRFVDAYRVGSLTYFNAIWDKGPGNWVAAHGLNGDDYDDFVNDQFEEGRRIMSVDSYFEAGTIRYAVIMDDQPHPGQVARHGQTPAEYQAHFDNMKVQGKVPVIVSSAYLGGQRFVTSVFEDNPYGTFFSMSLMTSGEFQTNFDTQKNAGRALLYLNTYNTPGGSSRFSGVWVDNPPYDQSITHHVQNSNTLQQNFNTYSADGFATRIISGYASGGSHRFAAHWTK